MALNNSSIFIILNFLELDVFQNLEFFILKKDDLVHLRCSVQSGAVHRNPTYLFL